MSRALANSSGYTFDQGGGTLFDLPPEVADADVPVHANAGDTERAAADRVLPIVGKLRHKALGWIINAGSAGLTAIELTALYAAELGKHLTDSRCRNSMAPRITELKDKGLVVDSGRRRDGSKVWVAVTAST